jgi:hypothetical protein
MAENPPGDRRDRDDLLDILPEPPSPLIAPANDELRPLPRRKRRPGFLMWFLVFLGAGAAAAGTGWFFLKGGKYGGLGPDGQPPTIRADQRPYKTKPQSPGGMEVPNQDKTVYDRLNPKEGGAPGQVESLLPSPEKPQTPPAPEPPHTTVAARPSTPIAAQPSPIEAPPPSPPALPAAPDKPPTAKELAAAPPPSGAVKAPSSPAAGKAPPAPVASPIVKVTPGIPPTPKAASVAATPGGAYLVQLGALKEEGPTAKEWAKMQKANPDLLGALALDVQRADLGAKGIFFRMRAGPLADADAAKALCEALAQRKQGCMVVKK